MSGLTVGGVVANLDSLSLVLELLDSDDGTEDLLLGNGHLVVDVGEQSRLDEITLVTVTLTTNSNGGTLLLASINVLHDTVKLELRDLGTLEGLLVEGVTQLVLSSALLEAGNELVVDTLLDQNTGTGAAALAVVVEDTKVSPGDGVVDVGIVEDNVGGLAAQLESNLLQVGLGSSLEDSAADESRSSEGDLVDVHVGGDGSTGGTAKARDDVNDTRGEASLDDQLGDVESGQRSLLGGLQDNSVTGSNGGTDLPGQHEKREVPGDDLTADTDGLVAGVRESLVVGIDRLTGDLVGPATVVAQAGTTVGDISLGHQHALSVVQDLDGGQGLNLTLPKIGQLGQHATTLGGGHLAPGTLESGAGSLDGNVDILLSGFVDRGNDGLVSGVNGLEGLAFGTLDELVVNEPMKRRQLVLRLKMVIRQGMRGK